MADTATIIKTLSSSDVVADPAALAALAPGSTIELGAEIGAGGFGTVYRCGRLGGLVNPAVVVKRYDGAPGVAPDDNAAVLAALHRALVSRPPAGPDTVGHHLRAVPFWVGKVVFGTDEMIVSVAQDLTAVGYIPFEDLTDSVDGLRAWLRRPITTRLDVAADFAAGHALLEDIGYIHADIGVENAFVHPDSGWGTLIDFDSGWIAGAPTDRPLAWGKPNDFIAPEVKTGGRINPDRIGPLTERWSVATLIHYLLFGVGPLFFLTGISERRVADYLADYTWPDIDQHSPLFNQPNRTFYARYLADLADLPAVTVELFRELVHDGSIDPARRPTSARWRDGLRAAATPPTFDFVTVSSTSTVTGRPVRIAWSAPDATDVFVDNQGPYPAAGRTEVTVDASRAITVQARNPHGAATHTTDIITVYHTPTPPDLNLSTISIGLRAAELRQPPGLSRRRPHNSISAKFTNPARQQQPGPSSVSSLRRPRPPTLRLRRINPPTRRQRPCPT